MAEELEVDAQLVGAACYWHATHNRIAAELLPRLTIGTCISLFRLICISVILWWVVCQPLEDRLCLLAVRTHAVQAQLGADL